MRNNATPELASTQDNNGGSERCRLTRSCKRRMIRVKLIDSARRFSDRAHFRLTSNFLVVIVESTGQFTPVTRCASRHQDSRLNLSVTGGSGGSGPFARLRRCGLVSGESPRLLVYDSTCSHCSFLTARVFPKYTRAIDRSVYEWRCEYLQNCYTHKSAKLRSLARWTLRVCEIDGRSVGRRCTRTWRCRNVELT